MPAYKDEKRNTWLSLFYYEDWQGNKKKKQKRGFKTKKEALEWENNFKLSANANMDMALGAFVEIYFRDKEGELKERSIKNKRYMIEAHILPYFENKKMNEITPSDIIQWQNTMREKDMRRHTSHGAKSNHCIIYSCKQYLQFVEQSMQESEKDGKAGC